MSGYTRPKCSKRGCSEPVVGRRLCGRHYQAAWKTGAFENTPATPRKKDRKVCPPEHKHAEVSTCYIQHQCRCDACMDHHKEMEARRKKLKAYGRFDRGVVPAGPVREHMIALARYGIGYRRAAELAGIGVTPARNLIWGRQDSGPRYGELQKNVKRETAEALLAVQPVLENLPGGVNIPARASVRRLQSLIAFGYSQARLARELGLTDANLSKMRTRVETARQPGRVRINAKHAQAMAALYDRLSSTPPPETTPSERATASRARAMGADHAWPLPMDWEAYDNDFDRQNPIRRSITPERRRSA